MFCPECGLEYEGSSRRCPECGVPLVAEPEEQAGEGTEFIPLVEVTEVDVFALVTSRLEEAGIPWFVQSEPPFGVAYPVGEPAVMIYVAENRLARARRLLEAGILIGVDHEP